MAELIYRVNIQSSIIPLLAMLQGETVILQDKDQTYVPNINPQDQNAAVDRGIPGIYYAENVMPSTYGYQSIGYLQRKGEQSDPVRDIVHIQATTNNLVTYAAQSISSRRIRVLGTNLNWVDQSVIAPAGTKLSTATVNGVSYLCVPRTGVYRVSGGATPTLQAVTLSGLNISTVQGITSSNGYLIAWTNTGVAWSSTSDPLDFVPSDVTGANSAQIQDAAGPITWCQDTSFGFLVYTTGNVVQSTWSGNVNFPWNFRGIPSSGGVTSGTNVSKESNGQHYVYSSKGLQQVYHTGAKTLLAYVTDFISGQVIESFNPSTNRISRISLPPEQQLTHAISFIADRYLCLSYGLPTESYYRGVVVFDTVQQRVGKLNINHHDCFEWQDISAARVALPRGSIGFTRTDGGISTVNFQLTSANRDGVMILGKFQGARGFMTMLKQASLEVIERSSTFSLTDVTTLDGKAPVNFNPGYLLSESDMHRNYNFSSWGKNHSLIFSGAFNINSVVLEFFLDGQR